MRTDTAAVGLNETHDPGLTSWIESANSRDTDFPIQNLPFTVFRRRGASEGFRGGVAIGDQVVDLAAVTRAGLFSGRAAPAARACGAATLNAFMAMGPSAWSALRLSLSRALRTGSALADKITTCLVDRNEAEYTVPARIGDYTDFYTSIHHAANIGKLFRPDSPLTPNYQWVPIGYHGRSSSIGISGQAFHRPWGQTKAVDSERPDFGPCRGLDYELEVGVFIGGGNEAGHPIGIDDAADHMFGLCLLNDWSARDIQAWEYQPLGPFLSKNFASTISPWIVTLEALAPYRAPWTRPSDHPQPLPYLDSAQNRATGALDIELEVWIETEMMRRAHQAPCRLSSSNYCHAYWTAAQIVAHHTVNGCNLRCGDLLGSGTMSGPETDQTGALIELTRGGKHPVTLDSGESLVFLRDGDTIILRGWCDKPDGVRIGFGEAVGTVLPAFA